MTRWSGGHIGRTQVNHPGNHRRGYLQQAYPDQITKKIKATRMTFISFPISVGFGCAIIATLQLRYTTAGHPGGLK